MTGIINSAPPRRLAVSTNVIAMENGDDPDFNNTHDEEPFEYYVRIEGEAVMRGVTQRELALWIHMVALELRKTKLAGEARTYAKRLIGEGYDTVQGLAELYVEDLVNAGMKKGDALLMGRVRVPVSQSTRRPGGEDSSKNGEGSMAGLANGTGSEGGYYRLGVVSASMV